MISDNAGTFTNEREIQINYNNACTCITTNVLLFVLYLCFVSFNLLYNQDLFKISQEKTTSDINVHFIYSL